MGSERRDVQRGGTYREVGHTQRGGTYRENMDRLPTLERFLCCCDLKTGTLIIGVFNLICAVLLGILSLFGLATMIFATVVVNTTDQQKMNEALSNFNNNFNTEGDLGQGLDTATSEEAKTAANVALIFSIVMMAILCIICVGYVIVASMLIHGARTSKPGLLMPWFIHRWDGHRDLPFHLRLLFQEAAAGGAGPQTHPTAEGLKYKPTFTACVQYTAFSTSENLFILLKKIRVEKSAQCSRSVITS